jgi:hypothetical protein
MCAIGIDKRRRTLDRIAARHVLQEPRTHVATEVWIHLHGVHMHVDDRKMFFWCLMLLLRKCVKHHEAKEQGKE